MVKKVLFLVMLLVLIFENFALADVVTVFDGHYEMFGQNISFKMAYLFCSIFLLIIAVVGIILIIKKVKSKKAVYITLIVVVFLILVLKLPTIMPGPRINHGARYKPIATFYQQFEGENQTPSQVRALINLVKEHNANQQDADYYGEIKIEGINEIKDVSNVSRYDIKITEYYDIGAVRQISIEKSK